MDSFMEMGTLGRHNEIITEIVGKLFGLWRLNMKINESDIHEVD